MTTPDLQVRLDPGLSSEFTFAEHLAAEVVILRARSEGLRGRSGERALRLALRASQVEQELLRAAGLDDATELLRSVAEQPAVLAAVSRWREAESLARKMLSLDD